MAAKRRLDFSTPAGKRSKTSAMILYRGVRTEMKYFDTDHSFPVTPSTATQAKPLCQIAQGTGGNARVGNRVKIHRVQIIVAIPTGSSTPIRMEIVLPKKTGTTPGFTYSGFVNQFTHTTMYQKFLHTGTEVNPTGVMFNYKLPMGLICSYDGGSGTTINRGDLLLCLATQSASSFDCTARVWYTDA